MSREAYNVAKPTFYLAAVMVGLSLWWFIIRRHPRSTISQKLMLILPCLVAVTATGFPFWLAYVTHNVPIRDEGMELGIEFQFYLGPAAVLGLIAGIFAGELRREARCLSAIYFPIYALLCIIA